MKAHRVCVGEEHYNAKLTATEVLAIRSDPRQFKVIAADYGISRPQVGHIKHRRSWAHLKDEVGMSEFDLIRDERRRWLEAREQLQKADDKRKEWLRDRAADVKWWLEFGDRFGWGLVDNLNQHRATFRTKHGSEIVVTDLLRKEIEDGAWAEVTRLRRALDAAGIVLGSDEQLSASTSALQEVPSAAAA